MNEDEAQKIAADGAAGMVAGLRRSNEAYARETGRPSKVSDAEYAQVGAELFAKFMALYFTTRDRHDETPADVHREADERARYEADRG